MRTRLLRGAALAAVILALSATACSSPLASCGLLAVETQPADSIGVAVAASDTMFAHVLSGCPDKVGPSIDYSSTDTTIAIVREITDTAAVITGIRAGQATIIAAAHDRSNIRNGILVRVRTP